MMLLKLWRVAKFEYACIVFRTRFLLVLLSPVFILFGMGVVMVLMVFSLFSSKPVGIVDQTGSKQSSAWMQDHQRVNTQTDIVVFADE